MPIPNGMFPDFRESAYKIAILFGAILIIYGVLWLLVELSIIPAILLSIFPGLIIILIGIFIIYAANNRRNMY